MMLIQNSLIRSSVDYLKTYNVSSAGQRSLHSFCLWAWWPLWPSAAAEEAPVKVPDSTDNLLAQIRGVWTAVWACHCRGLEWQKIRGERREERMSQPWPASGLPAIRKWEKKFNIKFKNNYNLDRWYYINVIQSLHCYKVLSLDAHFML